MFREIRDHIINIVTSRLTVLMILFAFFAGVLLYRCFNLQIVNGEEYLNDFILQIEKTRGYIQYQRTDPGQERQCTGGK